jgi:hypothetical protein
MGLERRRDTIVKEPYIQIPVGIQPINGPSAADLQSY